MIDSYFFFFNDTATTEIYTLSLHDALPIYTVVNERGKFILNLLPSGILRSDVVNVIGNGVVVDIRHLAEEISRLREADRKSTRLNSSHANISYAVFCLKKKKKTNHTSNQSYCITSS